MPGGSPQLLFSQLESRNDLYYYNYQINTEESPQSRHEHTVNTGISATAQFIIKKRGNRLLKNK